MQNAKNIFFVASIQRKGRQSASFLRWLGHLSRHSSLSVSVCHPRASRPEILMIFPSRSFASLEDDTMGGENDNGAVMRRISQIFTILPSLVACDIYHLPRGEGLRIVLCQDRKDNILSYFTFFEKYVIINTEG